MAKSGKCLHGGGRKVRYQDIEKTLIDWFKDRRDKGVRVTGASLKREVHRLHKAHGNQSFKGTNSWFQKFKKRHKLSFRRVTHVAQKSPDVIHAKVDTFLKVVLSHRKMRNYADCFIANMDETPIWLEMPGKITLEHSGAKQVSAVMAGQEKKRYTVILTALADGTKRPVFVLLPGVRPPVKHDIPRGVIIYMCGTGKSWANEESTVVYMNRIWGRNNRERRLMVWDTFRGHGTDQVKSLMRKKFNTDVIYIPGGCTSKLQPADVSWNKPFKNHLQNPYDEWLFSGEKTYTAAGNMRAPTVKLLLQWIKEAWDKITPEIIRKSFKKTGISCALDGSEDHLFDACSEDEDDESDPFEGFEDDEIAAAEELTENVSSGLYNVCLSEDSNPEDSGEEWGESETDDYVSPNSPGH